MYDGTIAINSADTRPAYEWNVISLVSWQVTIEVNPANNGPIKTHTFLIYTGRSNLCAIQYIVEDVTIIPG